MAMSGFRVNFGKGKSAIMVSPRGRGEVEARREITQCQGILAVSSVIQVELASQMTNVGSMVEAQGSMKPELTYRASTQAGVL
eukprot:105251-Pyramimonas_sp.AAC.1